MVHILYHISILLAILFHLLPIQVISSVQEDEIEYGMEKRQDKAQVKGHVKGQDNSLTGQGHHLSSERSTQDIKMAPKPSRPPPRLPTPSSPAVHRRWSPKLEQKSFGGAAGLKKSRSVEDILNSGNDVCADIVHERKRTEFGRTLQQDVAVVSRPYPPRPHQKQIMKPFHNRETATNMPNAQQDESVKTCESPKSGAKSGSSALPSVLSRLNPDLLNELSSKQGQTQPVHPPKSKVVPQTKPPKPDNPAPKPPKPTKPAPTKPFPDIPVKPPPPKPLSVIPKSPKPPRPSRPPPKV